MTDSIDLDAIERACKKGLYDYPAQELCTELRQTRKERDEAQEKVHFYEVQYQDEIGINGLIEERGVALATLAAQKAEIERLKQSDLIERTVCVMCGTWRSKPCGEGCIFGTEQIPGQAGFRAALSTASQPKCNCGDSGVCKPGCPRYEQKMQQKDAPSQSDRERAKQLIKELCGGESVADDDSDIEPTARTLAAVRREEQSLCEQRIKDTVDRMRRGLSP